MQGVLYLTLIDSALNEYTTNITEDLPAIVGNGSAYLGFTGGDGAVTSIQDVSNFLFSYTAPPVLSIAPGPAPGTEVISWSISVSPMFQLLQSSSLTGPWSVLATAPFPASADGTMNQVTVSTAGGVSFYELQLLIPAPYGPP